MVSGAEEAALAFDGAVRHLRVAPPAPVLVVDIGGGSTELVLGDAPAARRPAHSMDIGSVRLHERHLHSDPPTPAEVAACVADIDARARRLPGRRSRGPPPSSASPAPITTVAAGVLDLPAYDRERDRPGRAAGRRRARRSSTGWSR